MLLKNEESESFPVQGKEFDKTRNQAIEQQCSGFGGDWIIRPGRYSSIGYV